MNGPIPTGANDLSQALRVVLIRLIDLHFKSGTRMPGVKTHNFEAEIAEFMHEPWRHRSSFDPYASVISCIPTHHSINLFWNGRALAPPQPPTGIVDQTAVIFCETSKPTKWVIDQPPILRITGRCLPDRDTIGGSRAARDYRMSRDDNAFCRPGEHEGVDHGDRKW
ncbi:MAG: hypothetical protein M3Z96_06130 [Pseudomonadota bacterium]|nr:hypothetical protein [Pseudomonadota bacterium]